MSSFLDRLRVERPGTPGRRFAAGVAGAALLALLTLASVAQKAPAPANTPAPAAGGAATPQPGSADKGMQAPPLGRLLAAPDVPEDPINALESLTPPDGKWLKLEDGTEYFLTRLKKDPQAIEKLPDGKTLAYKKIYRWQYDREDAEYFYVRVYRPLETGEDVDVEALRRAAAEEQAQIEESYKVELSPVDRLVFSAFDAGLPREGQWRQGFDVADMNGDGHLDILHGSPRKQIFAPVVFLGDGKGGWRYWSEVTWPRIPYDYGDAAAGDFDRDGRMDIALGIHLRGVKVLLQKSPGVFADASEGLIFAVPGQGGDASNFASRTLEVADWNGDGKLDVIALGEGARQSSTVGDVARGLPASSAYGVVIFLNQGEGKWSALSEGARTGVFGDSLAFGHFDDDDRIDLVTASAMMGNENVLFLNDEPEVGFRQVALPSLPRMAFTYAVATGDFDEDGRDDIVTSFGTHEGGMPRSGLALHTRDAEGVWQSRRLFVDLAVDAIWTIGAGDLDGDGHLDLVAPSQRGKLTILLGDGKGGMSLESSPELDPPGACRGYAVRLADVDGDGRSELLAAFAGEVGDMAKLLDQPTCPGEGSLRVWKMASRPADANS